MCATSDEHSQPTAEQPTLPGMRVTLGQPVCEEPAAGGDVPGPEAVPGAKAATEMADLFAEASAQTGRDAARLFDRWLTCCHLSLNRLPSLVRQLRSGDAPRDSAEQEAAWKEATAGLPDQVIRTFSRAFGVLLEATIDGTGALTYADVLGQTYQQAISRPGRRGNLNQFFTPWPVAYTMAQMMLGGGQAEGLLEHRLQQRGRRDPYFAVKALTLAALGDRLAEGERQLRRAELLAGVEPIDVLEPAVGSGVMLLAGAKAVPRWMVDDGVIQFFGVDVDPTCVQMARLNVRLYGLGGSCLRAAEALTPQETERLPWPYGDLYANVLGDVPPGAEYWRRGLRHARAGRLDEWEGLERLQEGR